MTYTPYTFNNRIGIKYYILHRPWHVLGHGRCKILWPRHKKLCIFWVVNTHNTNQLNTFALFPGAETWRMTTIWWATTSDQSWHLLLWPWRWWSFMDGQIDFDRCKWPVLKLFVKICDMWPLMTDNDDHLF